MPMPLPPPPQPYLEKLLRRVLAKGSVWNATNPSLVPTAKQSPSWLKERWRMGDGGVWFRMVLTTAVMTEGEKVEVQRAEE